MVFRLLVECFCLKLGSEVIFHDQLSEFKIHVTGLKYRKIN